MAQVILFGGGDGGGIIIGPNGVRPIPPFDPGLRALLRGVAAMLRASEQATGARERKALGALVGKAANLAVEGVEAVVGPLDAANGLVFQDDDGGFTCGSTGKPPIPLPWPPPQSLGLPDLVASGLLERELAALLTSSKGVKVKDLLEDPGAAAKRAGVELSQRSREQLAQLAPSRVKDIADPVGREVVQFFHKVIEDGRHLDTWTTRPFEVAKELGVKLSPEALDRIVAGGNAIAVPGADRMAAAVVVVIVVVVIMLVPTEAGKVPLNIRDRSNVVKF